MIWVKIRSWHAMRPNLVPGVVKTLCGRVAFNQAVDVLPLGERSCETCLRLYARKQDL